MQTQWRVGGMGGVTGLDYSAVESTFRLMQIPTDRWPPLFEDIRVLEMSALKKINEKSNG